MQCIFQTFLNDMLLEHIAHIIIQKWLGHKVIDKLHTVVALTDKGPPDASPSLNRRVARASFPDSLLYG